MKNITSATKKFLAAAAIILAGMLWGCMGLFVRFLNSTGLTSMEICVIRAVFTTVIMFIFLLIYNPSLLKIKAKDFGCFIHTGLFSILFFNWCYFTSIEETQLSFAVIMLYTAPIFVMILSAILFKEKITLKKVIALIVAFTGCVFVSISGKSSVTGISFRGILFGLGSGLGYALYSIFSRYALKKGYKPYTIIFWTFFVCSIFGLNIIDIQRVAGILAGKAVVAQTASVAKTALTSGAGLFLFCILYSITVTVLPYILYTQGLVFVENSKASVMAFSEPLTATLLGIFVYSEIPNFLTVCGIFLIFSALFILNAPRIRKLDEKWC